MKNQSGKNNIKLTSLIISIGLVLVCFFSYFVNTQKTNINVMAEEQTSSSGTLTSTYLSTPTLIESDKTTDTLFVYDSYTRHLLSFNASTKEFIRESDWTAEVMNICHSGTHLLALMKESGNTTSIYLINQDTLARTRLQFNENDNRKVISTFTATNSTIYMYAPSDEAIFVGEVDTSLNKISTENGATITKTDFHGEENNITQLFYSGGNLYFACTKTNTQDTTFYIYELLHDSEYVEPTKVFEGSYSSGNIITATSCGSKSNYILTSKNQIITLTENTYSTTRLTSNLSGATTSYKLAGITEIDGTLYLTDESSQMIWAYDIQTDNLTVLLKNNTPNPNITGPKSHRYIKTTGTASLYATPYSTSSLVDLPAGTPLTIIAGDDPSYEGFYYCIYTTGTNNIYAYLSTSSPIEEITKTSVYIPIKVISDSNSYVYYLPSSISDEHNQGFKKLQTRTTASQILAKKITNGAGDDFYLIELPDGTVGYIRYSQVTSNFASIQTEKLKCNGKTKRETTLLISPSADSETNFTDAEIENFNSTMTLTSNTRIYLNEKVKAGNTYTKVTYQTDNGETYIGYILTADLDADGLTTLQTIGVILVVVNILILISIFIARKKVLSRKEDSIPTAE